MTSRQFSISSSRNKKSHILTMLGDLQSCIDCITQQSEIKIACQPQDPRHDPDMTKDPSSSGKRVRLAVTASDVIPMLTLSVCVCPVDDAPLRARQKGASWLRQFPWESSNHRLKLFPRLQRHFTIPISEKSDSILDSNSLSPLVYVS